MPKRDEKLLNDVGLFVQKYARKAQRGIEPNDRSFDRKIEQKIKTMKPEDLSRLLGEDSGAIDNND
ncbi:MAG: hypothetical protein ABL985_20290 [Casimicrobium sp.]